MPSSIGATAGALAIMLTLGGCGLISGGHHAAKSPQAAARAAKPGDMTGGRHYRDGYVQGARDHVGVDVHRVERYPSYSVLYLDVYAVGHKTEDLWNGFSGSLVENGFGAFGLIDPVNGKYYHPLAAGDGTTLGTHFTAPGDSVEQEPVPGNRYAAQVYFPPLPDVRPVTVSAPGTLGEMTGIPVMDSGRSQAEVPRPTRGTPPKGQPVFWQVRPPSGRTVANVQDLHGHTEGGVKSTTRDGGQEKIGLRTDVLFAFDKASLSPKATGVLDDAIEQTRAQADPAKPPITITGYTDSKGGDAYNIKLSQRRAAAVQKYISGKLGTTYRYQSTGKGEADPVAPNTKDGADYPAGRAKNRRVEIGYRIKQQKPPVTTKRTATPGPGAVDPPAAFRPTDGPVVGSVHDSDGAKVDVHPFYRDGAYMVGVLHIHGQADGGFSVYPDAFNGRSTSVLDVFGAYLGGVVAIDPAGPTRYYDVRRGPAAGTADKPVTFLEADSGQITEISDHRAYIYYPAPPAGVTKIDVRLGELGTVHDVPVQ